MTIRSYPAVLTNVVDGDTIDVIIDLGLGITTHRRLRVYDINCPELHTKEGPAAKEATIAFLSKGSITITTRDDKIDDFGRVLATVNANGNDLGTYLIMNNFAVPYKVKSFELSNSQSKAI